jgi:glutaminyl-tRNA synthetase
MHTLRGCLVERATASDPHGEALQFERQGYFSHDDDSRPERLVFNRTASLRESPGKPPQPDLVPVVSSTSRNTRKSVVSP